MREAVEYLLGLGHTRVVTVAGPTNLTTGRERLNGYHQALASRGVSIPGGLCPDSFDDAHWRRYIDPPLTVVAQPVGELGKTAAELLFDRLTGRTEPVERVLRTALLIRGSCAPPTREES